MDLDINSTQIGREATEQINQKEDDFFKSVFEEQTIQELEKQRSPSTFPLIPAKEVREYDILRNTKTGQYRIVELANHKSKEIFARTYGQIKVEGEPQEAINIYPALERGEYTLAKRTPLSQSMNKNETDKIDKCKETVINLLLQGKRAEATEQLVKYIKSHNHISTIRHDDKPQMWIYRDGIYTPNGRTYVEEITREIVGTGFTTHINNDVIRKIQADTYIDQDTFFRKGDEHPHLIPVENGVLDINTHTLQEFTPTRVFFNKLPVKYDPKAACPYFKKFLSEIVTERDAAVLQEFAGFLLLREYKYEKSLMLYGTGRNGKSKLLTTFKTLLGDENVSSISLQDMEKDQFAIGELHGKLANIAGDISDAAIQHSGNFKELTGRGRIQAARKFLPRVTFVNYAKMIFAGNEIPPTRDMSKAFFDRWILIEFTMRFLPKKEIDALPEEERHNVRLQNPEIIDSITTPSEMSGILNWALEGYARLRERKDFSYGSTSEQVRNRWVRKSDSFKAFCMDYIEESWEEEIHKAEFQRAYSTYCREHRVKAMGDKHIKRVLAEEFGVTDRKSGSDYFWVGVRLKKTKNGQVGQLGQGVSTPREIFNLPIGTNTSSKPSKLSNPALDWVRKQGKVRIIEFLEAWPDENLEHLLANGDLIESPAGYLQVIE